MTQSEIRRCANVSYRERRKALGLTQAELARRLGVKVLTIKRREKSARIGKEAELAIKTLNSLKTS